MGLLARAIGPVMAQLSDRGPMSDFWYGGVRQKVTSGVNVSHETAMNYSGVWAATRLISDTISTIPRIMFKQESTQKVHAKGHPTYKVFRSSPNPEQSGVTFFSQLACHVVNWGNGYAEKRYDGLGRVVRVWPIHPSRIPKCNIRRDANGELVYHVQNNDGSQTPIPRKDMYHVPGIMSDDGITGKGVIEHGAESIGMGLATEQHGASFFGNGAAPAVVMTHPKTLGPEAADSLRRSWHKRYSGPHRANGLLVLEEGTTITTMTVPPEQAQFLQTRQFNITEIARWYNLPPHLLRELSKSSFNNIESESLHFVLISIMPWLVKFEEECNRQLLTESDQETHFFKFMLQGLLRGDMAARSTFYKEMFAMGVFSINDILELEDRNPIGPTGDIRLIPLNMETVEVAYRKSQKAMEEPKEEPSIETPAGTVEQSEGGDVQATALNGAQITALLEMGLKLALGELPKDGTHAMIEGSFPLMDKGLIDTIVADISKFAEEKKDDPPPEVPPGQPPFPPKEQPKDEEPPAEEPELKQKQDVLLSVARTLFLSSFNRLLRKEAKGAQWAAEDGNFLERAGQFLDRHKTTYLEQIEGPITAIATLGIECNPETLMESHLTEAYESLVELSGTVTAGELPGAVETWAVTWTNRGEVVAEKLFAGEFKPKGETEDESDSETL